MRFPDTVSLRCVRKRKVFGVDIMDSQNILRSVEGMYQDSAVRDRTFYPDFRRQWDSVLRKALESGTSYLPENPDAVYTVGHSYGGIDLELHFDQLKMGDWYQREVSRRSSQIFVPKRLKRSRSGVLSFHESICSYDGDAPEPALDEKMKNIIACALPGRPPELRIVYGNKWVDSKFNPLLTRSLSLFLVNTDYVPAFLGSPVEVALYLFLMDCCIIKEDYTKVKDDALRPLLHIFRPSPMLKIKGLI